MAEKLHITINVTNREGQESAIENRPGQDNLMQLLYDADQDIEAVCGGCASCATCHVLVSDDWVQRLPERDDIESMLLQYQEHFDQEKSRLSCQIKLTQDMDGLSLRIAPEE
jgi:2Fe-2S ferredoxin